MKERTIFFDLDKELRLMDIRECPVKCDMLSFNGFTVIDDLPEDLKRLYCLYHYYQEMVPEGFVYSGKRKQNKIFIAKTKAKILNNAFCLGFDMKYASCCSPGQKVELVSGWKVILTTVRF